MTSIAARPTTETPIRVRRTMCTVLASRSSTREPRLRGVAPSPEPCVSTVGTHLTSRYPGSWRRLCWRTIHGCGPAPEFHRLPLAGSTATANRAARVRYHERSDPQPPVPLASHKGSSSPRGNGSLAPARVGDCHGVRHLNVCLVPAPKKSLRTLQSARRSTAVFVRAATNPGQAATDLASTSAPSATRTTDNIGTLGWGTA